VSPAAPSGGYESYLDGDPVIVTAALTGGIHGKEANPNLPETPAEVAAAARECERAGAAVVHLHARRPNGERAFSTERFQTLTDAVREATEDVVIQHSTGGTGAPAEVRRGSLRTAPPPEMASLDVGPLNRARHLTAENTRGTIDSYAAEMRERGIVPELEAFNSGHRNEVHRLVERDAVPEPPYVNLIFGPGTLERPHPRNLLNAVADLPDGAEFNTLAFGPHQLPLTTVAMTLGGHVRVGLEDNLYYRRGELATSNAQLVERTVSIAETLGRPAATPAEARAILDLPGR
jgi:3-keto-5-aminohexanoate cleavage enzyme